MREIQGLNQARWIAIKECPEQGRIDTVWFRRRFRCAAEARIELLISACSRYKLYLNGELLSYGPCKGGEEYQYFDRIHLAGGLVNGENELLVEVVSFPDASVPGNVIGGPDWSVNAVRYAALAVIEEGGRWGLSTGNGGWEALRCAAMESMRNDMAAWLGYTERVDLARSMRVSETNRYDWRATQVCGSIDPGEWGEVPRMPAYERPIPPMELGEMQTLWRPSRGESVFEGGTAEIGPNRHMEIELDAGEETTAFVYLAGVGGRGAVVRVRYAEAYWEQDELGRMKKNDRLPSDGRILDGFSDEILPNGEYFEYSPFWFRTFRYLRLEIETGDEALCLSAPGYRVTRYPLQAVSAVHADLSGWVAPLWEISLRSLRCCMHETFEDCPYYEQMQYTMDTRLQMLFAYHVAADTRMARRTLFDYHASQMPNGMLQSRCPSNARQVIPAFSLHWIFMLWDYYMQTGDLREIRKYFGTMDGVLGFFRARRIENGLVGAVGYWAFVDWVTEWERGVPNVNGEPEGSHNFLYAYALGVAAEIARALGFGDIAAEYEAEKAELLAQADAAFYDAERGLYRYNADKACFCQHTQVWAVLAGVRDGAFRRGLMERLTEDDTLLPCSFPMQYYLFRAYEAVGMYGCTERLWDIWKRALDQHLTTVPEVPVDARSDCHAWGALLLYEYPAKMLGVCPASPGWKEIQIAPKALFMKQAEGRACVPDGYIDVKWSMADGAIALECELQTDCPVRIELPGKRVRAEGRGKRVRVESALQ